jgi:hypothetical protein
MLHLHYLRVFALRLDHGLRRVGLFRAQRDHHGVAPQRFLLLVQLLAAQALQSASGVKVNGIILFPAVRVPKLFTARKLVGFGLDDALRRLFRFLERVLNGLDDFGVGRVRRKLQRFRDCRYKLRLLLVARVTQLVLKPDSRRDFVKGKLVVRYGGFYRLYDFVFREAIPKLQFWNSYL